MESVEKLTSRYHAGYARVERAGLHYNSATQGAIVVLKCVTVDKEMSLHASVLLRNYVRAGPRVAPFTQISFVTGVEGSDYVYATGV